MQLSSDVEPGDLAIVAKGDRLQLAMRQGDGGFTDATTNEPIPADATVIGPVVEESAYYTEKQLRWRSAAKAYEAMKVALEAGFATSARWEQDDNADFDVATTTRVLAENALYRIAEDDYLDPAKKLVGDEDDEAFNLRLFAARCYLAGVAAGGQTPRNTR